MNIHIDYLPFHDIFCENFRQTKKEWDCEGCHGGVTMFGVFYQNDAVVQAITTELQGEDFCGNPENGFNEDQIAECAVNIGAFMPPALKIIGDAVIQYNNEICNAWYEGICEY